MMGHRQVEQAALFYEFSLEKRQTDRWRRRLVIPWRAGRPGLIRGVPGLPGAILPL
jgi:hypothetical protein